MGWMEDEMDDVKTCLKNSFFKRWITFCIILHGSHLWHFWAKSFKVSTKSCWGWRLEQKQSETRWRIRSLRKLHVLSNLKYPHTSKSFNFTYATIAYVYICFLTYWLASPKPNYTKYHNINRTVNLYSHSNMEKIIWAFRTAPWTSPHLVPAFANTSALARSRILAGKMSWQVQTSISNFMENYHNLSGRSAKPQLKNAI